jgi:hypothetical protein
VSTASCGEMSMRPSSGSCAHPVVVSQHERQGTHILRFYRGRINIRAIPAAAPSPDYRTGFAAFSPPTFSTCLTVNSCVVVGAFRVTGHRQLGHRARPGPSAIGAGGLSPTT